MIIGALFPGLPFTKRIKAKTAPKKLTTGKRKNNRIPPPGTQGPDGIAFSNIHAVRKYRI
jgi:hypothetical protein